jgi:hypothetical protein
VKADFQYGRYLARHKWFVFVAGLKTKAPLWRLIIHDWSKLGRLEWCAYRDFFYGFEINPVMTVLIKERRRVFDVAWLHHIHLNKHHWNHHCIVDGDERETLKVLKMPEKYVREMVADWAGAGRAITGKWEVKEWYETKKEQILLHPDTRVLVEKLLGEVTFT